MMWISFESVVILDSGKTPEPARRLWRPFESVVILDSGKTMAGKDHVIDIV